MFNAKSKNGFTLVEVLLSFAVMAILLTAIATAFNASAINYRENENIFQSMNSARQAMFRITNQLRTANAVDPNLPANECTLITADNEDVTYRYDSSDDKLYFVTNDDLTDSNYILCDNVSAMNFVKATETEDSVTYVKNVQISLTVQIGDVERKVCGAVVIRKNLD
ncbi:type II secretion system protein J [Planctomycetota bacterium]